MCSADTHKFLQILGTHGAQLLTESGPWGTGWDSEETRILAHRLLPSVDTYPLMVRAPAEPEGGRRHRPGDSILN